MFHQQLTQAAAVLPRLIRIAQIYRFYCYHSHRRGLAPSRLRLRQTFPPLHSPMKDLML